MEDQKKKRSLVSGKFLIWAAIGLAFGLFLLVAVPNFIKARSQCCANACLNNLRQIDAAANQFALEHDLKTGALIRFPDDLTLYIKLNSEGKIPPCPAGGFYSLNKVGDTPICSKASEMPWHKLP
jgi:competence protein ComGC